MASNGITEAVVDEIKQRIDLSELIASYGIQVKTAGSSMKACCPFHHEKTPSFNINNSKGFYHCFGCGESGDAIKFVQKFEGLSFVEAVKKLAGQCGITIKEKADPEAGKRKRLYSLMAELAQFYHRCLKQAKEAELARNYLKERDLGETVQDDFLIGYAPTGIANIMRWAEKYGYAAAELEAAGVIKAPRDERDRGYHRFGGRLMFSIRDKQGRVVAFSGRQLIASKNSGKYVNSPETEIFKKSKVLFGFDKASAQIAKSPHHEAIVCEGQIDTIRLHIGGFPVAVASQGTAFTEEHVKMLKRVADQVVLVFDDDGAGHKATIRTAGLFLAAEMPVRVVSLPDGDDPDSFLRRHPKEDFQRLLDNAESIMSFQVRIERAKEAHPDTLDAVARVTKAVIATIAQSKSAVLKAGMVGEAAKLMHLPSSALQDELDKFKVEPVMRKLQPQAMEESVAEYEFDSVGDEETADDVEMPGKPAEAIVPPPNRELAFCGFLMANEYGDDVKKMSAMIGEFLPPNVFAHDFTRRFVETWRAEVASGEDMIGPWSAMLEGEPRSWFASLLDSQQRDAATEIEPTSELEDFIRLLWCDWLLRMRGNLSASEDDGVSRDKRLRWMTLAKQLPLLKWSVVKDIIRDILRKDA